MKFGQLLYGNDEEVFLCLIESHIQHSALSLTGGVLNQEELEYLKEKAMRKIANLIIKIKSSGIGK